MCSHASEILQDCRTLIGLLKTEYAFLENPRKSAQSGNLMCKPSPGWGSEVRVSRQHALVLQSICWFQGKSVAVSCRFGQGHDLRGPLLFNAKKPSMYGSAADTPRKGWNLKGKHASATETLHLPPAPGQLLNSLSTSTSPPMWKHTVTERSNQEQRARKILEDREELKMASILQQRPAIMSFAISSVTVVYEIIASYHH